MQMRSSAILVRILAGGRGVRLEFVAEYFFWGYILPLSNSQVSVLGLTLREACLRFLLTDCAECCSLAYGVQQVCEIMVGGIFLDIIVFNLYSLKSRDSAALTHEADAGFHSPRTRFPCLSASIPSDLPVPLMPRKKSDVYRSHSKAAESSLMLSKVFGNLGDCN